MDSGDGSFENLIHGESVPPPRHTGKARIKITQVPAPLKCRGPATTGFTTDNASLSYYFKGITRPKIP
jgi:hypothetical protein